jgi:hypothetical protein
MQRLYMMGVVEVKTLVGGVSKVEDSPPRGDELGWRGIDTQMSPMKWTGVKRWWAHAA